MSDPRRSGYRVKRVTLRCYHDSADPEVASRVLGLNPSRQQRVGDPSSMEGLAINLSGWFLTCDGTDMDASLSGQLQWLITVLLGRASAIRTLRDAGWSMDILAEISMVTFGGPVITSDVSRGLGLLDLTVWLIVAPTGL